MVTWALRQHLTARAKDVHRSMHDPRAAQLRAFDRLKKTLHGSGVSIQSGFDRCRTLEDCRHLPASDSGSLSRIFTQIFTGGVRESRLVGRTRLTGFARTSGSFGEPKDIPMNRAYLRALDRALLRVVASQRYTTGDWQTLLSGKRVVLGSRPRVGASPTGLPICDVSGLIFTRSWKLFRQRYIPKYEDLWIQDWSTKVERAVEQAGGADVISISGVPALAMDFADRARARYGVRNLNQIWPNLNQYHYGGVHLSDEQKQQIRDAWFDGSRLPIFVETYFATEAPLAFAFDPRDEGLALNSLDILFLFRPASS